MSISCLCDTCGEQVNSCPCEDAHVAELEAEIERLRGYLNEIADTLESDGRFAATVAAIRENLALEDGE